MPVPHPIPYQGSKRGLAEAILSCFPAGCGRVVEPFAGSAAVSLAAAYHGKAKEFLLNDINKPLIQLWEEILKRPKQITEQYAAIWAGQHGRERPYFNEIRRRFNATRSPDLFLFLLTRCVKASVRYNSQGEFNQSPDNRRKGTHPLRMAWHIEGASQLLSGRTITTCGDFRDTLRQAGAGDLLYLDPPYQGVCRQRDPRYSKGVAFEDLVTELRLLNRRNLCFILSYDGRTGEKAYGRPLPDELGLVRMEFDAGPSTQATLLGKAATTFESVYLSEALRQRVAIPDFGPAPEPHEELALFQVG